MEFIEKFKNYLLGNSSKASQVTVKNYLADVKQFISWVESAYKKSFNPEDITIQTIQEFKAQKSSNLSASSIDRHISSLRKFFTFLKLDGQISHSPFDQLTKSSEALAKEDPYRLHDFKNYLYVYNASNLTIKNYVIDIKQFLLWAEEVLRTKEAWQVSDKNLLGRIDNKLVEEYKNRLLMQHVFSPSSINRKLSSLRKYLSWAGENGLLNNSTEFSFSFAQGEGRDEGKDLISAIPHPNPLPAMHGEGNQGKVTTYSNIPPVRLFQKLANVGTFTFDLLIVTPVAHAFRKVEHEAWKIKGKKIFIPSKNMPHLQKFHSFSFKPHFSNISKEFYSPLSVSTKDFPLFKKIVFHMRHTRPQWYHRYHQLAIAHYFNWAVLIIFASAIGFGMYNNFVEKPNKSLAALPNQPIRVLSFQGRLTDANDNPIASPTNIRFVIYNTQSSSSSARLWEEVDKVSPDQDGIFSLLLGSSGASDGSAAPLCNSGNPPSSPATSACGIPQSLFANNSALWLGVTVEATSELAPREQLATVAFASNAETLQGLPPITQSGAGTNNVVLALNSSGNLSIGASTTFQSTSGAFNLSGNTLALNTNTGSGGNINLAPDGLGMVDIQRPVLSSSNYGDIASVPNAFTIEDLAAILATSSGQSALTINQNGIGPIISASHSGTPEFTVDSSGNTTVNGNLTVNGTQITDNTYAGNNAVLYAAPTTGLFTTATTNSSNQCLLSGSSTPKWASCNITGYWQLQGPVLSPADLNNDLAVGGNSTSSAKFQVFAESVGPIVAGTASTSGNLTFTGGSPVINVLNGNSLTVKTSPGGDSGTGYINALTIGPNTTQFYSGNSLSSNGNLTLAGTITLPNSNTLTGVSNYLELSNGISVGAATTYHIDSSGNAVLNSLNLPITGGVDGYWSLSANVLSPSNTQNDFAIGGTSTSSARFHAYGSINQGTTPSASVSGKTSFSTLVVDNSGSGSIFTASTSGLTKFTILNSGSIQDSNYTTDKGIAYFDSTGLLSQTAQGAAHTVLHGNGSSAPTFSAIDLTADVGTSILPVGNGGTGANLSSGAAVGDILYADSTTTFHRLAIGTGSQCLVGGTTPTWATCPGGSSGTNYWQLNGKVVSPADLNNDLTVGGNSTSSAKFQVFAESVGTATAGTASTSGNLTFFDAAGTNPIINVLNGNSLKIKTSPGGDTSPGYIDALIIAPNGNLTSAGNSLQLNGTNPVVTAGGTNTLTLQSGSTGNIQFFGSSNNITSTGNLTLAGTITAAASNTINGLNISSGALSGVTGYTQASGNFDMSGSSGTFQTGSGNVSINGSLATSLIPTGNGSINLGSSSHYYGTVYANAFSSPIGNGVSGFWTISNNTNLYPSSSSDDLLIGGTGTNSASFQVFSQSVSPIVAGTASTSGYLTFKDAPGTNPEINILNGNSLVFESSPGGDAGAGYGAILTLGNNSTTTTLSTASNNNNLSLLAGSGVTTIGTTGGGNIQFFGNSNTLTSGGNLTLAGTITLPHSITLTGQTSFLQLSDGLELGGGTTYKIDSSGNATLANVLPTSDGVGNIGASGTAWNNVYAKNINLPITGGLDGFWQLSTGANYGLLAPTNIQNDFAVAGASTSSAKFQVFGQNYTTDASINSGTIPAGTATTSGNLSFRGTPGSQTAFQINLLNASNLGFYESLGGDKGLTSTTPTLYLANNGRVGIGTNAPTTTLDVAGNASISSILTFRNGAGTIQATSNNQLTLGGNTTGGITFGSNVNSNIIPTLADTFNLGSATNEWNNIYVKQIISPVSGGIAGYWQLNNNVLSPTNNWNDLDIGGTATGSAFQVFGTTFTTDASINSGTIPAGTATTSGNLSFRGTPGSQTNFQENILNGASLGFYNSVGGDKGITSTTPTLYLAANANVGIGNSSPTETLSLNRVTGNNVISFQTNGTSEGFIGVSNNAGGVITGSSIGDLMIRSQSTGIRFSANSGTSTNLFINGGVGNVGIGASSLLGNAQLVVNQVGNSGLGDIFTASASGATKFVVTNDGNVGIGNLNDSNILSKTGLQVQKDSLGNALAFFQQLGNGDILTASTSAGVTAVQVTNSGQFFARNLYDLDNPIYYIDPAGLTVSASVAGSMTFTPASEHDINFLNNSSLNFQSSPGGDAGLLSRLFIQGSTGNVAIGTTSATQKLTVIGDAQIGKDATVWGVPNYLYRRQVSVANTSGQALINYQVKIVIDTASLIAAGKMRSDCKDTRFTDADGSTSLTFWRESGCNSNATTYWVQVPSIPGPTKNIYFYYDNTSETTDSSTTNVFNRTISNVQAAYRLDEPTYDPINDYSGNNNVGTASGTTVVAGKFGNARQFNGSTDEITISPTFFTGATFTNTITLSAWVNVNTFTSNGSIINKTTNVSPFGGWSLWVDSSGHFNFGVNVAGTWKTIQSSSTYSTSTWYYVTGVYDNAHLNLYVNGASAQTAVAASGSIAFQSTTQAVKIGNDGPGGSDHLNGTVDEARIYSGALSSTDVSTLYGIGGNQYGYVTQSSPNTEYVRNFASPEPSIASLGQEENSLQNIPSFYVQQSTGNVALGTLSVASTSALLTSAGDIKSGLYDPTTWGSTFAGDSYRARITIDNTLSASTSANANYQVQVTANTAAPIALGKMRSDCNDIRFSDADGSTNLSYWIESGCNTTSTIFWVKVPQLPVAQKKNIYMYYGNSSANTSVSTTNVFNETIANVKLAYRFDETSATTATDYSGNGNNATATGTTVGAGVFNNARVFNGTSDSMSFSTSPTTGTGSFSIFAWVKTSTTGVRKDIIAYGAATTNNGVVLYINTSNQLQMDLSGTAGPHSTATVTDGFWHYVGVVNTSGTFQLFIDGVPAAQSGTSSLSPNISSGGGFISREIGSNTLWFNGSIDEVRVYNAALTNNQVGDVYAKGNYPGAYYGYVTTNSAGNEYLRAFQNPEPTTSVDTEQDPSQVNTTLYVDNAFNRVGINTANPTSTLDLTGSNTNALVTFNQTGTGALLNVEQAGTSDFYINNAGNVGIGTTSPDRHVLVSGSGDQEIGLVSTDTSGREWTIQSTGAGTDVGKFQIIDRTSRISRLTIDSSGNFGIGTTNPTSKFVISGLPGSAGTGFICNNSGALTFNNSSCTGSLRKYKINITDFTNALSEVMQLHPITYNWNSATYQTDPGDEQQRQVGLIAEDVVAVDPLFGSYNYNSDGSGKTLQGVDYPKLSVLAIAGLQQLDASVSAQQSQIYSHSVVLKNVSLTSTGDLILTDATPSADFTIPHYYTLSDAFGKPISQMGAFLELVVGNLRAGSVNAQQVLTNSLAIATNNVSIAGQSLNDYIVSVVNNAINNGTIKQSISSPLASVDELHTNLISPLASSSAIALDLSENSKINVKNTFSQQTVASIDNNGNATFSGSLNSQNLAVNADATVSGTLYANRIKANSIEGLSEVVSTLSAQNITNVTNIYFATPSSSPTAPQIATGLVNSSSSSSGLPTNYQLPTSNYLSIASYSAYFAYVPNLNATTGMFEQGLVSLGPTSLSDTSINGTLSIGSSLMLSDNSINVLGNDFAIQPLRQGGVSFEGGLLAINTNGDLTVNGNAVFNKNLAVNTLSPIAGHNLSINLSNGSASGSAAPSLNISNASGSAIFAVNQLGDLVASGTATIGKLNLNLVQPALALSDTEVVATGSAGTATIKAYQREVTIDNPNVTANSLIYITPVGTNQTPYLERQISGKSFSVGIPTATVNNVNFNWLIVN